MKVAQLAYFTIPIRIVTLVRIIVKHSGGFKSEMEGFVPQPEINVLMRHSDFVSNQLSCCPMYVVENLRRRGIIRNNIIADVIEEMSNAVTPTEKAAILVDAVRKEIADSELASAVIFDQFIEALLSQHQWQTKGAEVAEHLQSELAK